MSDIRTKHGSPDEKRRYDAGWDRVFGGRPRKPTPPKLDPNLIVPIEPTSCITHLETCSVCGGPVLLDQESIGNVDRSVVAHAYCERGLREVK